MIKYLLFNHIHITYCLTLFLPLIAMGFLKFSQTHQTLYILNGYVTKKEEHPECFQAPCLTPPLEDPVRPLRGTVCLLFP